jgi:acyl-CoA synthetase (NDP forming)
MRFEIKGVWLMEKFFNPKSVVLIGASNSPYNLGATIYNALAYLNYPGKIFVVNSKGEPVGKSSGYNSILQIEDEVDLAVIITPSKTVPEIAAECGEKGIRNLIIESSGFAEEGPEGMDLQQQLDQVARKYNIRYMGPNCLGVLNPGSSFCCFFGFTEGNASDIKQAPGKISYIIQSGGVGVLMMDALRSDVDSICKLASVGNSGDIDESDLLQYYDDDKETKVIGLYLENVQRGKKLIQTASRLKKPVLLFKVGKSTEGAAAATSHTAGMLNDDNIFNGMCKQSGIIRLETLNELYSLPKFFTKMPVLKGNNIVAFSNSGGFGCIATDIIKGIGLEFPQLSKSIQRKMKEAGNPINCENPIDIGPTLSKQAYIQRS